MIREATRPTRSRAASGRPPGGPTAARPGSQAAGRPDTHSERATTVTQRYATSPGRFHPWAPSPTTAESAPLDAAEPGQENA